ncbi:hypothetical protein EV424DRAFT_1016978 [Suillus variegatus]|nr:hypothetical protein EV424DRAFT_1016978 [Suillus variegatus]
MTVASSGPGVRIEYQQRHDFFIDCLAEEVHLHAVPAVAGVWEGRTVYQAPSNLKKSTAGIEKYSARNHAMFSFIPPGAGMYLWVGGAQPVCSSILSLCQMKFHLNQLDPSFASGDKDTLDTKLWIKLPENGVLFRPGWISTANAMIKNSHSTDSGHFYVCFINIDVRVLISMHLRATWFADLKKSVSIFEFG